MNYNISFRGGQIPQKAKNIAMNTAEKLSKNNGYFPYSTPIEKGLVKTTEELYTEAEKAAINIRKPFNVLEAEARALKEKAKKEALEKSIADAEIPSIPYN